jgi:hypothetical protein
MKNVPWPLTSVEEHVEAKKVTTCSQNHTTFLSVCGQEPEIWRKKEPLIFVRKKMLDSFMFLPRILI